MKLTVENLSKKIKDKTILNNINLELESGNVYGFVGRNGCGKTMLFRAVSGLINIDSGKVILDGKELHVDMQILPDMGIILENAGLYTEFTGKKNLEILSKIRNKISSEDIDDAIRRVGLDPDDKRTVRKYSLGMKQRIALAQAIMEHPSIIILDEPTNALDEDGVKKIRQIIMEEKKRGSMILLASHNREDIEQLADKVFYMVDGEIKED